MTRLLFLAALFLLVGCVATGPSNGGFAEADSASDPEEPALAADDDDEVANPLDDDDDEGTPTDPLNPIDWDSSAPDDGEDGWVFEGTLVCGIMERAANKAWERSGPVWEEIPTGDTLILLPGLEPCTGFSQKFMEWSDDDSLYLEAGGLGHWLTPTETDGLWSGTVAPLGESSPECDAALADYGMQWPVDMTLRLDALTSPSGAPAS